MNKAFFLILILFNFFKSGAATCLSNGSGAWNLAATWSCGSVPGCGDSIVIQAGHTVTITADQSYMACNPATQYLKITVFGCLKFTNGNRMRLPCNSRIYIMPGPPTGSIVPGAGGGSSTYIELCSDQVWQAADGTLTGPSCLPNNLPGCGAVLPITLNYFKADICNSNNVCLDWETLSEKGNAYFEVHRSPDASEFYAIGNVPTKAPNGYSTTKLSYNLTDNSALNGVSYYRLKQFDADQSFSYSKIVAVNIIKEHIKFVIYPNPNSGEFTADLSGFENDHEVKVVLRSLKGNTVFESSFHTSDKRSSFQIIPQSKLPSGIYICSLYLEEIEYQVKVIVNSQG